MTTKAPVSVCLIVKNESGQLESCLKSIKPHVSEIVVVDTGSNDGTPDIAKRYADIFEKYTDCNDPDGRIASFSKARQRSFDLATQPWVMWVDGDDEVVGAEHIAGLIKKMDEERAGGPGLVMLPYEYSHDHHGHVTCLHYRERIVTPKSAFKWTGPVHEVLQPLVPDTKMVQIENIRMIHRRQSVGKAIEPNRNLRILKAYYDEVGESDVRQLYYLGLEYGNAGEVGNSIKFHKRYTELSGWDDEKCLSMIEIVKHYQTIGDYESSVEWALRATTIKEGWAEPYFFLAKSYYFMAQRGGHDERRNWERCVHFARQGLSMPLTKTILFVNPLERNYEIHKYLNLALNKLGDVHAALDSAETALKSVPDDASLLLNRTLYIEHIAKNQAREAVKVLMGIGKLTEESAIVISETLDGRTVVRRQDPPPTVLAPAIVDSAPQLVVVPLDDAPTSISSIAPSNTSSLNIALYVGRGVEPWNPDTFEKTGLGGSETMAWEMSWRLARLGHKVRFYGDCQGMEGLFRGVEFFHADRYKDIECDVLITSRRPSAVDDSHNVKARARLCWVHDVACGSELNHSRGLRIDRFLALSQWHKDFFLSRYSFLRPEQVIVTRNGINLDRFSQPVQRKAHRAVYSSSPDRGLEVAIRAMPIIRSFVPDAELHIYYGFKNWEAAARSMGDTGQINLIEMIKRLIADHAKDGVVYHDRVSQDDLAREFLRSGVWSYPTWFSETSCITAMEAQAAGLRVVTSPIAALNETVGSRGSMIAGDWLSPEYLSRFSEAVVKAMMKPGDQDRDELMGYARQNFGLDSLAEDWSSMLLKTVQEVEDEVVPPYRAAV